MTAKSDGPGGARAAVGRIIGPTNGTSGLPSACIVIAQLQNGVWQRVYRAKAGTFDCASDNVTQIKMNIAL